jgi:hypothetical protein
MKVAIVSDTHDNTPAIVWIIEYLNEQDIAVCLHAGDIINPGILWRFQKHYQGELHFVFGNNDGEHALWERRAAEADKVTCHLQEMRLEVDGKKIFMNHYSSIGESMVKSCDFDLVIGGHDHRYRVIEADRGLFINPGNTVTKDKWLPQEPDKQSSFVVIDLTTMKPERVMLPKEFQAK